MRKQQLHLSYITQLGRRWEGGALQEQKERTEQNKPPLGLMRRDVQESSNWGGERKEEEEEEEVETEWLEKSRRKKAEDEEETRCVKGERCPCFG